MQPTPAVLWRSWGCPGGETGIRQRIYLPVHRTLAYEGSLGIKHLSGASAVSVSIRKRNSEGAIFAEAKLDAASHDWTRYVFHPTLERGTVGALEPADFVISLANDGRALVDQISLSIVDVLGECV
jgi:alpha-N-arabinofuranosidase